MFISSDDLNGYFMIFSLISAIVFLSLTLISYGLQMKKLMILSLVFLLISSAAAVVQFWIIYPRQKDRYGGISS